MSSVTPISSWQFNLRHTLLAIAALNVCFGAIGLAGLFGFVVFAAACGIVLAIFGWRYHSRRSLILGAALTLGALATLIFGSVVAVGIGHTTRLCTIEVVREDNLPVRGAIVYVRDVVEFNRPNEIPSDVMGRDRQVGRGITNGGGVTTIPFQFTFTDRTGLFVNEAHLWIAPQLWIQVDAHGYDRKFVRLEQHLGHRYDYFKQPLPKIKVRLKATDSQELP